MASGSRKLADHLLLVIRQSALGCLDLQEHRRPGRQSTPPGRVDEYFDVRPASAHAQALLLHAVLHLVPAFVGAVVEHRTVRQSDL